MTNWLPPQIIPFQRLQVRDGVQLNLDKWNLAHQYHDLRQSYYYQSLYQPGIIYGLEVKLLNFNTLEINPGIALDYQGNIIIVAEKQSLTINLINKNIYIVITYREQQINLETVEESYHLTIKTEMPKFEEIELGRIKLANSPSLLPENLDLNYRYFAQPRSEATVKIAVRQQPHNSQLENNLLGLLKTLNNLYPRWQGQNYLHQIYFENINNSTIRNYLKQVIKCDLIYLKNEQFEALSALPNFRIILSLLKFYLENGGILLLEDLTLNPNSKIFKLAELLNDPLQPLEKIANHPIWSKPFLFQQLPQILNQKLSLWLGGGIILVVGNISSAWGFNPSLSLPLTTIQNCQELGINILHFAWYRKHLTQLQNRSIL
jgi:hypothetical protein